MITYDPLQDRQNPDALIQLISIGRINAPLSQQIRLTPGPVGDAAARFLNHNWTPVPFLIHGFTMSGISPEPVLEWARSWLDPNDTSPLTAADVLSLAGANTNHFNGLFVTLRLVFRRYLQDQPTYDATKVYTQRRWWIVGLEDQTDEVTRYRLRSAVSVEGARLPARFWREVLPNLFN